MSNANSNGDNSAEELVSVFLKQIVVSLLEASELLLQLQFECFRGHNLLLLLVIWGLGWFPATHPGQSWSGWSQLEVEPGELSDHSHTGEPCVMVSVTMETAIMVTIDNGGAGHTHP